MLGAKNSSGNGIYQRIFHEVTNGDELRAAIALAVRELRAAMEKEDNPTVTKAHIRNLQDLDPICLAYAYAFAERNCIYWPSPGQMRELAGHSEEDEAARALEWVFTYLRRHGVDGKPTGGAAVFRADGDGRRVLVAMEPLQEPAELPGLIEAALTGLGAGSMKRGLFCCSQHLSVKGWEEGTAGDSGRRAADRIEQQWARWFRQARREQAEPEPNSWRKQ